MAISRRDAMLSAAALLPAGMILSPAFGQVGGETTGGTRPAGGGAMGMGEDPLLAARFLFKGRRQIEVCTFAKGLTKNEDVKSFLQAEIDEHEKMKADLQKLGFTYPTPAKGGATGAGGTGTSPGGTGSTPGGAGSTPGGSGTTPGGSGTTPPAKGTGGNDRPSGGLAAPDTPASDRTQPSDRTADDRTQPGTRAGGVMAPSMTIAIGPASVPSPAANILMFEAEVIEQCIANYKALMQKKTGIKLEKAIVGDQKFVHTALLDNTMVALRHASEKMQPSLKEALATIQKHIASLETIMDKLDSMRDNG